MDNSSNLREDLNRQQEVANSLAKRSYRTFQILSLVFGVVFASIGILGSKSSDLLDTAPSTVLATIIFLFMSVIYALRSHGDTEMHTHSKGTDNIRNIEYRNDEFYNYQYVVFKIINQRNILRNREFLRLSEAYFLTSLLVAIFILPIDLYTADSNLNNLLFAEISIIFGFLGKDVFRSLMKDDDSSLASTVISPIITILTAILTSSIIGLFYLLTDSLLVLAILFLITLYILRLRKHYTRTEFLKIKDSYDNYQLLRRNDGKEYFSESSEIDKQGQYAYVGKMSIDGVVIDSSNSLSQKQLLDGEIEEIININGVKLITNSKGSRYSYIGNLEEPEDDESCRDSNNETDNNQIIDTGHYYTVNIDATKFMVGSSLISILLLPIIVNKNRIERLLNISE